MSYGFDDVLDGVRKSRAMFLKHLVGLSPEQWAWKPYPESKNIAETVAHLITDDNMATGSLKTGEEPDYDAAQVAERDPEVLLELLSKSHNELINYLSETYIGQPLDTMVSIWGTPSKLGTGVAHLSSEDAYHSGQVAYIRMATDPSWDYYATIYG